MGFTLDEKIKARDLYVEQSMTYEQVSGETGISLSALKQWGTEQKWHEARKEFESEVMAINAGVNKLKVQLLKEALANGDPQKCYAFARLQQVSAGKKETAASDEHKGELFILWLGKLLEYLRDKDQETLRFLQPHLKEFAASVKDAA